MNENFLHYIWQHKLFYAHKLVTIPGEEIEVIDTGKYNTDAGPDFFNAKIKINNTIWAGNIEIHINASDWYKHNHHSNKAYDSVILHLCINSDTIIHTTDGREISQAIITFPDNIEKGYKKLLTNKELIACRDSLKKIDSFIIHSYLERLLYERLEDKSEKINELLIANKHDWEESAYISFSRSFGFSTNSDAFERLARLLPYKLLQKHKSDLVQLEALLFGVAGFLKDEVDDKYHKSLQKEFTFLQQKYKLKTLNKEDWKLLRLRPNNFPYQRIAQFAMLIHKTNRFIPLIIENTTYRNLQELLKTNNSEYWKGHYSFGKTGKKISSKNGKETVDLLIINSIVPLLFCYGKLKGSNETIEESIKLLNEIKSEENKYIRIWEQIGITPKNAGESQALLQLSNKYCFPKKCLQCRIGHLLVST